MSLSNPYCTLVQLQREIKNTDADSDDTVLAWHQDCINRASRFVDQYTHRDFLFHDYSSTALPVEPRWILGNEIWFPWPIKTLTELTVDEVAQSTEDYTFRAGKRKLVNVEDLPVVEYQSGYVSVKGTFGYGTGADTTSPPVDANFPAAITRATVLIAAAFTADNRKEVAALDGTRTSLLDTNIPDEAIRLLNRWTLRTI